MSVGVTNRLLNLPQQDAATALRVAAEPAFDFGGADFAQLFDRSDATAFQHPVWLEAFYRTCVPARGARAVVVTGRGADGELRFVLPLIIRQMSGVGLLESADLGVSDYAAPVVDRAWWETFTGRGGMASQVAGALPPHDILRLKPVRPEHVSLWRAFLPGDIRDLGFGAHAVPVAGPMESWRERALDGSFSRMLARKRNRFFRAPGAGLTLLAEPPAIADALARMAKWRAGRFGEDIIQDAAALSFYQSVATAGAPAGFARTYEIRIGGEPIGHAFGIAAGGRLNYLLIGCDYAGHGRHSPGLQLYDGMIADWIAAGGEVFDFTIGDEPFKADFGTRPTPMSEVTRSVSWRGALALAALRLRNRWRARESSATIDAQTSTVKE